MDKTPTLPSLYAQAISEVFQEMLWPTHCAVCNKPGSVLCNECCQKLPYLDYWMACPTCGAPQGKLQCCECNSIILSGLGIDHFPFDQCVNATLFDDPTARLVTSYKDRGEQRLAETIAAIMKPYISPDINADTVLSFIPATKKAYRKRGFDHIELLAQQLSGMTGLPYVSLFERPHSKDQRKLSRNERSRNVLSRFALRTDQHIPPHILLIDDVFTTGATLTSACLCLREHDPQTLNCLTFTRVM